MLIHIVDGSNFLTTVCFKSIVPHMVSYVLNLPCRPTGYPCDHEIYMLMQTIYKHFTRQLPACRHDLTSPSYIPSFRGGLKVILHIPQIHLSLVATILVLGRYTVHQSTTLHTVKRHYPCDILAWQHLYLCSMLGGCLHGSAESCIPGTLPGLDHDRRLTLFITLG